MGENCAFCGREKEEKDLIIKGKIKICFLCDSQQNKKPKGKVIKAKHGIMDNSNLLVGK